jgi:hypothetical protein
MNFRLPHEIHTTEEVVNQWKDIRSEFMLHLDKVPDGYFTVVPAYSHWSVSHLAEHVYLSQMGAVRPIPIVLSGKFGEDIPAGYSIDYPKILQAFQKPTGVKNPDAVAPKNAYTRAEIYSLLKKAENKMISVTEGRSKEDLCRRGVPHPAFGLLHHFDWLWVMSLHEYSHLVGLKERLNK